MTVNPLRSGRVKVNLAAEITPAKLRSGDPAALAALCDRRGAAVFAYCQLAAGSDGAATVAAAAFAEFRRAIQPPGTLTRGGEAERLLRAVSRRAALEHIRGVSAGHRGSSVRAPCDVADHEIVAYLDRTLAPADHDVVAAHVGGCGSCTVLLERLKDAEPAFGVAPGTPLPVPVAREILTALVAAAPVGPDDGSQTAVHDEALRLLTGEHGPPTADPVPPAPQPPSPHPLPPPPASRAAPPPPAPVPPTVQAPPAGGGIPRRRRFGLPAFGRARFGPGRSAMLLRGAIKLVLVTVAAGAAGTLLGIAIAELTGDDATPTAPAAVPASSTPRPTTTAAATPPPPTEKVKVSALSATALPTRNGGEPGLRLTVRATIENASGRAIRPTAPRLLVDDLGVAVAPESGSTGGELLAPSLADGATAEGTLRFDVPSVSPSDLAAARVRLQLGGKFIVLNPVLAEPAAGG